MAFAVTAIPRCSSPAFWESTLFNSLVSQLWCSSEMRSCHTSGRDVWNDFLGNTGYEFVRVGNLLASRLVLMLLIVSSRGGRWLVEQPEGSTLPNHPLFQQLLSTVKAVCLHSAKIKMKLNNLMLNPPTVSVLFQKIRYFPVRFGWVLSMEKLPSDIGCGATTQSSCMPSPALGVL